MLTVRIPATLEKRLESLAKRTGRTKSFYVRQSIAQNIEDQEDVYLADLSRAEVMAGGALHTHEEMMRRYGV